MRSTASALILGLELGLLVAVQSCGQHVVHSQLRSLVERHVVHQAHMRSAQWDFQRAASGGKVGSIQSWDKNDRGDHGHDHMHEHDYRAHHHEGEELEGSAVDGPSGGLLGADEAQLQREGAAGATHWHTEQQRKDAGEEVDDETDSSRSGHSEARERGLQQTGTAAPAPIRLSVTYQMMGALDAAQQQTLTRVVEAVRRILQKFVNVKQPSVGGLLVDPYCNLNSWFCYPDFNSYLKNPDRQCGLATILPRHIVNPLNCTRYTTRAQRQALGSGASGPASGVGGGASGYGSGCSSYAGTQGEDTDMYLYITAVQNDDCDAGAAAWARPCLLDLGNNRPLLGAANVCPRALGLLDEETLTAVLTHEMIHALGFTDTMYNLTRRPDGTLRPVGELVQSARVGGQSVQLLVSPNVQSAARAQFGCPSLAGAQLEQEGSAGSAGSHWEYTHYQGEVMVASTLFAADGSPPALSNLTLAFLDDTGWYVTNRSVAGLLSWSLGAGCQLPTLSCSDYMNTVPGQRLFCDAAAAAAQTNAGPSFMCSENYMATGVCRALNFTGGCGLVLSRTSSETCIGPDAANDLPEVFGWGSGSASGRCFPVVYRFQAYRDGNRYVYPSQGLDGDADAACFDTTCSADGSKVYVKLLGQQFECPEGQYLNLPQLLPSRYLAGRIGPCPAASALCSTQSCNASACNTNGGDCLNGACYCHLAYGGADCSFNLITGQPVDNAATNTGSGTGASSSPPPPKKVWTQVVQVTMAMNNSVADVQGRLVNLQLALSTWSSLNLSSVVIQNVAAGSGNNGGPGSSYEASNGGRRRGLQQSPSSSSPPPPTVTAASVTTAWLTPSLDRPASTLLAMLKNSTQQALLVTQLKAAGFYVVKGGITSQSILTQAMVTNPATTIVTDTSPSESTTSSGRTVIIIAIAVGAVAVIGVIAAVVTTLVLRSRRQRRAAAQSRANAYQPPPNPLAGYVAPPPQAPPAPPGFNSGFAPPGADVGSGGGGAGAPSSNPFATSSVSGGPWGGGRYPSSSPEMAAYTYYSARGAQLASAAPPTPQSFQTGTQLSPLYSGPQNRSYM